MCVCVSELMCCKWNHKFIALQHHFRFTFIFRIFWCKYNISCSCLINPSFLLLFSNSFGYGVRTQTSHRPTVSPDSIHWRISIALHMFCASVVRMCACLLPSLSFYTEKCNYTSFVGFFFCACATRPVFWFSGLYANSESIHDLCVTHRFGGFLQMNNVLFSINPSILYATAKDHTCTVHQCVVFFLAVWRQRNVVNVIFIYAYQEM